ncbi:MAG: ABC transporter permease [Actinobacteria bacterium]|nr:ABC transporter permease [Actinomycetota bacterium]
MSADERPAGTGPSGALATAIGAASGPGPIAPLTGAESGRSRALTQVWAGTWPKVGAVVAFVAIWQAVVLSGWRPEFVLPAPLTVAQTLGDLVREPEFWQAIGTTLRRALVGFAFAIAIGTVVGIAVSRFRPVRAAIGSLITGLQTMPSIVWFPLAILLFGLNEQAITFVVILGAAPSIANGIISGIDHVPPAFTRLGTVLGAGSVDLYRHFVIPAALPSYVAGLNQGWAFAWRSLLAGELLVIIEGKPSLGSRLSFAQDFNNAPELIAYMVVILVLGMLADTVFSSQSRRMRRRRGLAVD